MSITRTDLAAIARQKRQQALTTLRHQLADTCSVYNHDTAALVASAVPCSAVDRGSSTTTVSDGAGGTVSATIQRWQVTIPADAALPDAKARFQVTVTLPDDTTVRHILVSTTRVVKGQSGRILIDVDCEEDFSTAWIEEGGT